MGKAQGYLVSIKGPEGLQEPRGENHKEIAKQNGEAITGNFDSRVEQLEAAGVLEGIKVYAKMRFVSCLSVDGPKEKIDRLQQYLRENGLGDLCENVELQVVQ